MKRSKSFQILCSRSKKTYALASSLSKNGFAELSGKLSTVKSLPNAMQAYQEWMTHHVEAMAKDSQKFMANSQKLMSSFTKWTPGSGSN